MAKPIFGHEVFDSNVTLTSSGSIQFLSIASVPASSDDGLQVRNLMAEIKIACLFSPTPGSELPTHHVGGTAGFFKWPVSAVSPTFATFNIRESGRVIGRQVITAVGTIPSLRTVRARRLNLKPGEQLFLGVQFDRQSSASVDMYGLIMGKYDTAKL